MRQPVRLDRALAEALDDLGGSVPCSCTRSSPSSSAPRPPVAGPRRRTRRRSDAGRHRARAARAAASASIARGDQATRMKPTRSAPASTAPSTSSGRVTPQTLTRVTACTSSSSSPGSRMIEVPTSRPWRRLPSRARASPADSMPDSATRDVRRPAWRAAACAGDRVDLQRVEVAGVDADDRAAEREGAAQLVLGVHLAQDVHVEVLGGGDELLREVVLDQRQEQQDGVGAVGPRLGHLPRSR